jgi:hypothetical protein
MSQPNSQAFSHLASFLLPQGARADSGIVADSPYRCFVEVGKIGLVTIMGGSRDAVFDQAARILERACAGLAPLSVACTLFTKTPGPSDDGRDWLRLQGAADGWTIIVNAGVAFSPTSLNPHFPDLARAARPHALKTGTGGA